LYQRSFWKTRDSNGLDCSHGRQENNMTKNKVKINLNKIVPLTYMEAGHNVSANSAYSLIEPDKFLAYSCFEPCKDGDYEACIVRARKERYSGLTFEQEQVEFEFEVSAELDFEISKFFSHPGKEYDAFMEPIVKYFGTTEIDFDKLVLLEGILTLKTKVVDGREKMEILAFAPDQHQLEVLKQEMSR
jgi:hypothetical protein